MAKQQNIGLLSEQILFKLTFGFYVLVSKEEKKRYYSELDLRGQQFTVQHHLISSWAVKMCMISFNLEISKVKRNNHQQSHAISSHPCIIILKSYCVLIISQGETGSQY